MKSLRSPVRFNKPFHLDIKETGRFVNLGTEKGNNAVLHVAFLTKSLVNPKRVVVEDLKVLNSLCSYGWLLSDGMLCGLFFTTKKAKTDVSEFKLVVLSNEPAKFTPNFNLEGQGLVLMQGEDGSMLFITNPKSPLLVTIDL